LSLYIEVRPQGETQSTWFQRSGSITVFIALFSEYLLFIINKAIFPTGIWGEDKWPMRLKYGKKSKTLSFLFLFSAALGTVIWGYGDLLITGL
jgi:hypothetical protein